MKEKNNFLLKIRFGKSSSQNYIKAVSKAKKFLNFDPISKDNNFNNILINHIELLEKIRQVEKLILLINNWKSTEFFINEEELDHDDLRNLLLIINCNKKYQESVIPENNCASYNGKNKWGCKFLNELIFDPEDYYHQKQGWWDFGQFSSKNIWKVDKEKLIDLLKREANLKHLYFCNVFDFIKILNILNNEIPDEIDIENSNNWDYKFETSNSGNILEKKPVGITYKRIFSHTINIFGDTDSQVYDNLGKNRNIPDIKFEDIGGIDDIIQTIREIIELPLKKPDLISYLGIKPHKGILLYGPPGCGKTMIAKAIANDINAHFISIKGPELLSKWHGQSEENLRSIFEQAKELQPSIIYFDEIDSIAQQRSSEESLRFDSKFVNQLLTLMDGIEDYGNICVIASTNRKELLDDAILRPGRFDFEIEIKKPTLKGCFEIFSKCIKKMPVDKIFDVNSFCKNLYGLTGADIAFVVREGAYMCLRRILDLSKLLYRDNFKKEDYSKLIIKKQDFEEALKIVKDKTIYN
ncbi:MAG: AAA family ATPase [Actinobacteria bacterium]|nr:AAA family ATPase [Actinomycetota bacterium]